MDNVHEHPEEGWPMLDEPTLVAPPPPPPPRPVPPPPDSRIGAGMVLALAALALAAAGIALAYFLTHRNDNPAPTTIVITTSPATTGTTAPQTTAAAGPVAVPYLVGLTERRAVSRLAQVGLRAKPILRPTQNTGRVVSQKPRAAAELAQGRTVTVVVDQRAKRELTAPNLVGQQLSDAQHKLAALGLHVVATQVTSTQPAGTIVDQAPKPGVKLQKGWDVVLSVARTSNATTTQATTSTAAATTAQTTTATLPPQPTSATMPDVIHETEQAAVTAMNRVGILASLFFVPSADPLGMVEQQAKPSGTTLPYRSHVQINVSTGPGRKPQLQVPNVVGRTLHDAVSALNGAQLRLIYVKFPTSGKVGVVVQQSPLAGGRAPKNAQVLVFLAVKR